MKINNILFLITSLYGGGAEKVCCTLASKMAEKYNVTIAYMTEKDKCYPIDPRCSIVHIPKKTCSRILIIHWLLYRLSIIGFVRRLKKENNIQATISLLLYPNILNILTRTGDKVITSERANPKIYQRKMFPITRIVYGLSDHVVFQSSKIRNYYGKRTQAHSSIIMNPVSITCTASDVRKKRIVTLGRLTDQKNHKMLIRSFYAFHKIYPEYTLSIYGDGELHDELEKLVNVLEMRDCIFLEGNQENVHDLIRDAEIFVLSSTFEGLSNSLLECMMMGIACISTRCEGSTDVIRNGENGLLIDIGDEAQLTEALCILAADPGYRHKLEEQAMADASDFESESIIRKWESIIDSMRMR